MALFKPYDDSSQDSTSTQPTTAHTSSEIAKAPTKKKVPTPTRRQAEQARRDRIQPVLTKKDIKRKETEAKYKSRDEAMSKIHAIPSNAMARDWVDRRWNIGEFAMPGMILIFVLMLLGSYLWPSLTILLPWAIYAVAVALVIDTSIMLIGLRHQMRIHFPEETMKGKWSYAFSRAMLFRRSRQPAPRVKRGTKFVWPPKGER